jgi:hypothetical protein
MRGLGIVMAHAAQALFILFVIAAAALLLVRSDTAALRILFGRPLILWTVTIVAIASFLIASGDWRTLDTDGLLHFIAVAVVAFVALAALCEALRIVRRLLTER